MLHSAMLLNNVNHLLQSNQFHSLKINEIFVYIRQRKLETLFLTIQLRKMWKIVEKRQITHFCKPT